MAVGPGNGLKVCGRLFSPSDLDLVREIIGSAPSPNRTEIARRTCERLQWVTATGELKQMSCRVALLRLHRSGVIDLPPPQRGNGNRVGYRSQVTLEAPDEPIREGAGNFSDLRLTLVDSKPKSLLWNEVIHRFHYLGFRPLPGAQVRYLIEASVGTLGAIGFGAAAWKAAPRDEWIGWCPEQRTARLHLVVNNARFAILPWVRSKNLASWTLARSARRLRGDFQARYGYSPVLLETFVERDRFLGTCYRAANWKFLGDTQGRGKLDRYRERALPVKHVFVFPLTSDFRRILCG